MLQELKALLLTLGQSPLTLYRPWSRMNQHPCVCTGSPWTLAGWGSGRLCPSKA